MQMDERHEGSVLIVSPKEQALDAYAAPGFRDRLSECIAQGHHRIVLDLSDVDFLDSTGLGAIVSSFKRLDGRGTMIICNAHEMVLDVFRLTRMDRVFAIAPSLERALEIAADRAA